MTYFSIYRPSLLLVLISISACQTPEGQEWKPTFGLSTTIVDSYEAELSALGYSDSESVDYSMTEIEVGATRVTPADERPIKHEFVGFKLGSGDVTDSTGTSGDLDEISGGGLIYFDKGDPLIPFLSIWSVITDLSDAPDLSTQLGIRFGGGVEYAVSRNAAFTLSGDYLVPLIDAEDSTGLFDLSTSGFAIRLGIRFVL